jgi:hypothetical protein
MELLQKVKSVNRAALRQSSMALLAMYSGALHTLEQLSRAGSKM